MQITFHKGTNVSRFSHQSRKPDAQTRDGQRFAPELTIMLGGGDESKTGRKSTAGNRKAPSTSTEYWPNQSSLFGAPMNW